MRTASSQPLPGILNWHSPQEASTTCIFLVLSGTEIFDWPLAAVTTIDTMTKQKNDFIYKFEQQKYKEGGVFRKQMMMVLSGHLPVTAGEAVLSIIDGFPGLGKESRLTGFQIPVNPGQRLSALLLQKISPALLQTQPGPPTG